MAFMSEIWSLLNSGLGESAYNMALDEALLEGAGRTGQPLLRFYGWLEPAATFGYSQSYARVAQLTRLRPLIRRCTGGGLVPHDRDWTYSLVFPPSHAWFALHARESYFRVHEWLRIAFAQVRLQTELSPERRPLAPGQCFVGAEQSDLLWRGAKIAGAAQRRTRCGLLIQGSVQPPDSGWARTDWEGAMRKTAEQAWGVTWSESAPDAQTRERALALTVEKYSQASHNLRR